MKLDIDQNEQTLLTAALDAAISSAQRQQNMKGKTQTMIQVYQAHERTLKELAVKIASAK